MYIVCMPKQEITSYEQVDELVAALRPVMQQWLENATIQACRPDAAYKQVKELTDNWDRIPTNKPLYDRDTLTKSFDATLVLGLSLATDLALFSGSVSEEVRAFNALAHNPLPMGKLCGFLSPERTHPVASRSAQDRFSRIMSNFAPKVVHG